MYGMYHLWKYSKRNYIHIAFAILEFFKMEKTVKSVGECYCLFVCFLREVDLAIQGARLLQKLWTAKVKIEFSWELKRHFSPTLRRIRDWKMRSYQRGPKFCKIRIFANFFLSLFKAFPCMSINRKTARKLEFYQESLSNFWYDHIFQSMMRLYINNRHA